MHAHVRPHAESSEAELATTSDDVSKKPGQRQQGNESERETALQGWCFVWNWDREEKEKEKKEPTVARSSKTGRSRARCSGLDRV